MDKELDGKWLRERVKEFDLDKGKVLDCGSLNVNGTCRDYFSSTDYVGIDIREGQDVDIIMNAHKLDFPDCEFDTVLCFNMLEHDPRPDCSLLEIYRVLKLGGRFLVAVPSVGYQHHDQPYDFWRVSDKGLKIWLILAGFSEVVTEEIRKLEFLTVDFVELGDVVPFRSHQNVVGLGTRIETLISVGWGIKGGLSHDRVSLM